MAEDVENISLLTLTAEIVVAHVSHNSVHASDLPRLISSIHGALAGLETVVEPEAAQPEHRPAVSIRKSLASDEHIISMIDGKPYRALRRHLRTHGLDDKEYRARYNLPADYPMVSKGYSTARAAMALSIGLGKKTGGTSTAVNKKVEGDTPPMVGKTRPGAANAISAGEGNIDASVKKTRKPLK